MKYLVIPDIHLKLEIIEKADATMETGKFDSAIFLGDFVDDWDKQNNVGLYEQTLNAVFDFMHTYDNAKICLGNHDVSYLWQVLETGYSFTAEVTVIAILTKIMREYSDRVAFMHKIDNVIFSHAGLTQNWLLQYCSEGMGDFDYTIDAVNKMNASKLWPNFSPIWARPDTEGRIRFYSKDYLQVVGHTPVIEPTYYPLQKLLVCDNFSTYPDGKPIGNQKLMWVDTETKQWGVVE